METFPCIERFTKRGVQRTMEQVRVILVSLLPALWVVTSGQNLSQAPGGCVQVRSRAFVSASRPAKPVATPGGCEFAQILRNLNRRSHPQPGSNGFSVPVDVAAPQFPQPAPLGLAPLAFQSPSSLARNWQFHWRTAAEPRAPSSVS